jgi:hypothetical protein
LTPPRRAPPSALPRCRPTPPAPPLGHRRATSATHCPDVPHPRRSFKLLRPTPPGSAAQPHRCRPRPISGPKIDPR